MPFALIAWGLPVLAIAYVGMAKFIPMPWRRALGGLVCTAVGMFATVLPLPWAVPPLGGGLIGLTGILWWKGSTGRGLRLAGTAGTVIGLTPYYSFFGFLGLAAGLLMVPTLPGGESPAVLRAARARLD